MATWNFDPTHTSASFSTRHMMVTTVRGRFAPPTGKLVFDPANPEAAYVEASLDAKTIDTGAADRDNHLRSADFLDVEKYPTISFKSTKVELDGDSSGKVYGDLTVRGVTRPVVVDVDYLGQNTDPWGGTRVGFEGSTKINREDFGLTWNVALETGGVLVGKDIKINLDLEAILVPETESAQV